MKILTKIRNAEMKAAAFVTVALVGVIGGATYAGATPPTPSEQIGDMATDGAADLVPIVLAVGAALATVAAVFFGVRLVIRGIRNGGRV